MASSRNSGKSGDYGGKSPKSERGEPGPGDIGVSGIGTIAVASVVPGNRPPDESYFVVSMYARWMMPHPITGSPWSVGASDVSAHRIISDLSAFIGHVDPLNHRIRGAGALNMICGVNAGTLLLVDRKRTVWARMEALGIKLIGSRLSNGQLAKSPTRVCRTIRRTFQRTARRGYYCEMPPVNSITRLRLRKFHNPGLSHFGRSRFVGQGASTSIDTASSRD